MGNCYFCKKGVNDDYYCYGCKHYVCEQCEDGNVPFGTHNVEAHRIDYDGHIRTDEEMGIKGGRK